MIERARFKSDSVRILVERGIFPPERGEERA